MKKAPSPRGEGAFSRESDAARRVSPVSSSRFRRPSSIDTVAATPSAAVAAFGQPSEARMSPGRASAQRISEGARSSSRSVPASAWIEVGWPVQTLNTGACGEAIRIASTR